MRGIFTKREVETIVSNNQWLTTLDRAIEKTPNPKDFDFSIEVLPNGECVTVNLVLYSAERDVLLKKAFMFVNGDRKNNTREIDFHCRDFLVEVIAELLQ